MMNNEDRKIREFLREMQEKHNIEILYACEEGSRATGLNSSGSDYDIRFIYRRKAERYITLFPQKNVIDTEGKKAKDEIDYSGWDLNKTFVQISRSNPQIHRWLASPVVYLENKEIMHKLRLTAKKYFNPTSLSHAYVNQAERALKNSEKEEPVSNKSVLKIIMPILSCEYIKNKGDAPPLKFEELVNEITTKPDLHSEVVKIAFDKKSGREAYEGEKLKEIKEYCKERIDFIKTIIPRYPDKKEIDFSELEKEFRKTLVLNNDTKENPARDNRIKEQSYIR